MSFSDEDEVYEVPLRSKEGSEHDLDLNDQTTTKKAFSFRERLREKKKQISLAVVASVTAFGVSTAAIVVSIKAAIATISLTQIGPALPILAILAV